MSGPPKPGLTQNETESFDGRSWSWDVESRTWRPTDPGPFEIVSSHADPPVETYWEPVLSEWIALGTVIENGTDVGVVVRSYDENELS